MSRFELVMLAFLIAFAACAFMLGTSFRRDEVLDLRAEVLEQAAEIALLRRQIRKREDVMSRRVNDLLAVINMGGPLNLGVVRDRFEAARPVHFYGSRPALPVTS